MSFTRPSDNHQVMMHWLVLESVLTFIWVPKYYSFFTLLRLERYSRQFPLLKYLSSSVHYRYFWILIGFSQINVGDIISFPDRVQEIPELLWPYILHAGLRRLYKASRIICDKSTCIQKWFVSSAVKRSWMSYSMRIWNQTSERRRLASKDYMSISSSKVYSTIFLNSKSEDISNRHNMDFRQPYCLARSCAN